MSSICTECGAIVASMPQHMKIHDKREFKCEVCGQLVVGRTNFVYHKQTHKTWTCPKCSVVIPHNSRTMHLEKCLKKDLTEFKCDNRLSIYTTGYYRQICTKYVYAYPNSVNLGAIHNPRGQTFEYF